MFVLNIINPTTPAKDIQTVLSNSVLVNYLESLPNRQLNLTGTVSISNGDGGAFTEEVPYKVQVVLSQDEACLQSTINQSPVSSTLSIASPYVSLATLQWINRDRLLSATIPENNVTVSCVEKGQVELELDNGNLSEDRTVESPSGIVCFKESDDRCTSPYDLRNQLMAHMIVLEQILPKLEKLAEKKVAA